MNPSRLFIERPVTTSLLMAAILLVGIVAYRFLPLSALPEVDYPTIQVQTFYPGASPEVMTSSVTAPLERQFGQMPSLDQMSSQSSAGASVITLRFSLDIDIDVAEQEVQAAINAANNLLPSDLPAPPIYAKVNPADAPILTLGVTSKTMKLIDVEDMIESRLVQKLSQVAGVGLVSLSGGQRPAIRIHADPRKLAAYGLNLDDLRTTIANMNVNTPKGNFDGPSQSFTINANDQIRDPSAYTASIVAYRNGAPIRLSDVATIERGPENDKLAAWMNRTGAIIVNIQRQPGANVIQVVDNIKKLLPQLTASLPADLTVTPLTDRTVTIRASVEDVEFELSLAVGLVVLVIFFFLGNPLETIKSLWRPLLAIGALALVYELGFRFDFKLLAAFVVVVVLILIFSRGLAAMMRRIWIPLLQIGIWALMNVLDLDFGMTMAVALIVPLVLLFLRNPATLIPSLSVPLSLVGTLALMYQLGFTLDNLSLMALTIATGFVVDDAIVMIENISRFLEMGDSPLNAALKGSEQIGFTIISLTISLIAVLIPLLFMGDVVGRLFHEFAITLAITIVISAIVSLTLVPMLCAKLLKQHHPSGAPRNAEAVPKSVADEKVTGGRLFLFIAHIYGRLLNVVLDFQGVTLLVALATFVITGYLYVYIPKGFFPVQDTGVIQGITQAAQSTSFEAMAAHQQALADVILKDQDVVSLSSFIGVDGSNVTLNSGRFLINLKPHNERKSTASQIIRRIEQETASVSGITLYMQPVQDLTIDTSVSPTQYQFTLQSANVQDLQDWTPKLLARLQQISSITDVASDLQQSGLSAFMTIDRPTAARFGITPATVDNALYDAFGQRIISTIFTQANQYRVILDVLPTLKRSIDSMDAIYLPSSASTSGQVPLQSITTTEIRKSPLQISHISQFPSTTISFNLAPGASLGAAVDAIRAAEDEIQLPGSFITSFQGAAAAFQSSLSNELYLLLAAVATMYIVLGVLYESFIHPLTILSTLPSAGIGALLALMLVGSDLDIIGIIGIVLLIGIVKKNAIMMIDFALDAQRVDGMAPRDAIYQACLLRLRPILMTTMAAMFGGLPLMLGTGVGSELRHPLGLAIVGGLAVSQVLTLFTTPVIYLMFERIGARFGFGASNAPGAVRA